MTDKTAIILPVYNEDLNLLKNLIKKIYLTLPNSNLFIIDDSKDSVKRKIKLENVIKKKSLKIITRINKSGRGDAVLTGLKEAIKNPSIKIFFEMDSDFSHDPKQLLKFIREYKKTNSDVIIGSRYLKSSKINNWPQQRLITSKIINHFLKNLFKIDIKDFTNGYRLYTRPAVNYLINKNPRETGFILLTETIYLLKNGGFSISEIPITFSDRKKGKSSVKFIDLLENLIGAFKIRFQKYEK